MAQPIQPSEKTAVAICMQAYVPVFLWGEPGSTKTKSLMALAKALGEPMSTIILSIRGPWDQGGLPLITPDGVVMSPPRWANMLCAAGHGVVFFDELNVAPATTQNSALRVVDEGYAGDLELPAHTMFVAAGNPASSNSGAYDVTPAMANRYVHIKWPLDPEGYRYGMIHGWPPPTVPRLHADWRDGEAAKRGVVAAFLEVRDLLHQKPTDPGAAGMAWPSHRTWYMAASLLAAADSAGFGIKSDVARVLVDGCVGETAGTEFRTWLVNLDLRPPEDYLSPNAVYTLPDRQDQTMATLDAVAASALSMNHPDKERFRRYHAAWKLLGKVADSSMQDLAIPAAMTLMRALHRSEWSRLIDEGGLPDDMEKLDTILKAANIDATRQS